MLLYGITHIQPTAPMPMYGAAGVLYGAYRTSWFRKPLQYVIFDKEGEYVTTVPVNGEDQEKDTDIS